MTIHIHLVRDIEYRDLEKWKADAEKYYPSVAFLNTGSFLIAKAGGKHAYEVGRWNVAGKNGWLQP